MASVTIDTASEICRQFSQEGLRLEVERVDNDAGEIEVRLELDDVECADCVMPTDYLEKLISTSLEKRSQRQYSVKISDPRRAEGSNRPRGPDTSPNSTNMQTVLDPTARGRGGDPDPGPPAGAIKGKTVLFRVDPLWRSWDWTVDEWSQAFRELGAARVVTWRRWQGVPGESGAQEQAEYEALIESADIVVSGLGNCGSCSAWTVRDALTALATGITATAVATEHFVPLAQILAEDGYRPGLRIHTLPYPLDILPEDEVRRIARDSFSSLLTTLGAEV